MTDLNILESFSINDISDLYEEILELNSENDKITCCGCYKPSKGSWCMPYTGPCNAASTCYSACNRIGLRFQVCDTGWSTNGVCVAQGMC